MTKNHSDLFQNRPKPEVLSFNHAKGSMIFRQVHTRPPSRLLLLLWSLATPPLATGEEPNINKTGLDSSLLPSARAQGMGGALSTLADGVHAAYYNPAGIGGIHLGNMTFGKVRQLNIPYVAIAENGAWTSFGQKHGSFIKLIDSIGSTNDSGDSASLEEDASGLRHYWRFSAAVNLVLGRAIIVPMADLQVAAFRKTKDEKLSVTYRSSSGIGLGMSFVGMKNRLYFGFFSSIHQFNEARGEATLTEIREPNERNNFLSQNGRDYSLVRGNIGISYIAGKKSRACFSLVARDLGNSQYVATDESVNDADVEGLARKQNVVLGFSLSPKIGKNTTLNILIEHQKIGQAELAIQEKIATALELNIGNFGSHALFSLRAGNNHAGPSLGLSINLGLVQFEYAKTSRDYGLENYLEKEEITTIIASTNVVDI